MSHTLFVWLQNNIHRTIINSLDCWRTDFSFNFLLLKAKLYRFFTRLRAFIRVVIVLEKMLRFFTISVLLSVTLSALPLCPTLCYYWGICCLLVLVTTKFSKKMFVSQITFFYQYFWEQNNWIKKFVSLRSLSITEFVSFEKRRHMKKATSITLTRQILYH